MSKILIKTNKLFKNVNLCKLHVKYNILKNICSHIRKTWQKRCIDHPKTINYQQDNCVIISFLELNENRVFFSVLTQILKTYKSYLALIQHKCEKIVYLKTGNKYFFTN